MSNKKNHYLMRDNIAKKIFKDEKLGKELTARLVSEVLHEDFNEIYDNLTPHFTDIAINALTVDSETDVMYQTDENIINVEINYLYGPNRKAQMNAYVCQLYLGQIKTSKDYDSTKGIIQILIEDYDYFGQGDFVYEVVLKDKKYNFEDDSFFKRFRISLDYLNNLDYNEVIKSDNELVKLLYFLVCNNNEEKNKVYKDDDFMKEVIKNADQIAGKEKVSLYLSDDEITRLDQEYYLNEGYEKGLEEKTKEMILAMAKENIEVETIAKCANLSIDEVKDILDNK